MVSNASEDLPEPLRPVMTTSESRGSSTVTSLRLCSRAPATRMDSWRDISLPLILRRGQTEEREQVFVFRSERGSSGCEQPGVLELGAQVADERVDPELLAGHLPQQLARVVLAPVHVDVGPQPLSQRAEVALLDPLPDV